MRKKRPIKKEKVIREQLNPTVVPIRNILFFAGVVLLGNAPLRIFSKTILPYCEWMAWFVANLVSLSGLKVIQNGVFFTVAGECRVITPGHTAITAMIVTMAFVLAYPSSVKVKTTALPASRLPFFTAAQHHQAFYLGLRSEMVSQVCPLSTWLHLAISLFDAGGGDLAVMGRDGGET